MVAYFRFPYSSTSMKSYLEPNFQMMMTWKISSSSLSKEACVEMVANMLRSGGRNAGEEGSSSDDVVAEVPPNRVL